EGAGDVRRHERSGLIPSRCRLRRPYLEGGESGGDPGRAADRVRHHHQPPDGTRARADESSVGAHPRDTGDPVRRRALLARSGAAATVIALWACTGRAVPSKKVPRLGLFQGTNPPDPAVVPLLDAFDMGLRDLGYIDGRTIQIERRYTQNRSERFDEIAAEFAKLADSDLSREPQRKIAEEGARSLKLEVIRVDVDVTDASNLPRALDLATTSGADALLVTNVPIEIINRRREIIAYAASRRIPAAYPVVGGFADDGGLMATGDNGLETFRRAASFVDRILKGANPADLPIEQPTQNELVVNLKTAKELGLVIPASIVGRATKVIQ